MSNVTEAWQCGECDTWHDAEISAFDCCTPRIFEGWKCETCGEYYELKDEAEDCCSMTYTCPACEQDYKSMAEAEDCCGCTIQERIRPEQLEQFGQQRLLP